MSIEKGPRAVRAPKIRMMSDKWRLDCGIKLNYHGLSPIVRAILTILLESWGAFEN